MTDKSKPDYHKNQLAQLKHEFVSNGWRSHWQDIAEFIMPGAMRNLEDTPNSGVKKRGSIGDNHGGFALATLGSGLLAGGSSPAKPWFALATEDPDRNEFHTVKTWLHAAAKVLMDKMAASNAYQSIHNDLEVAAAFGTSCDLILDDLEQMTRFYPQMPGQFYFGQNERRVIDTVYLERKMTVWQVVKRYGLDKVMDSTKNAYEKGKYTDNVDIVIGIEPRDKGARDLKKMDPLNMAWQSVHFEAKATNGKKLLESGFRNFPAICHRWRRYGDDVYGSTSPGMAALGEIKGLQFLNDSKDEVIDYKAKPPVQMPSSMKDSADVLPGGTSFYDGNEPNGGIRSAFNVDLDLNAVYVDLDRTAQKIDRHFFVDLFLMLANNQNRDRTAREVAELHEEKLLMLGPALTQLHHDKHDPTINRLFDQALEAGEFPPIPEELAGQEIKINYISTLAQAQKLVSIGSQDRLLQTVGQMGTLWPEALDKINPDNVVESYAEMIGTDPDLIVANEQVAIVRKERAEQQAALVQAEQAKQGSETARNLSQTDTEGRNALTALAGA